MATIWIVYTVRDNPNYKSGSMESHTTMQVELFDSQHDAMAAYSALVHAGLPKGAKFADIVLERSDTASHPPRRVHTIVQHQSF